MAVTENFFTGDGSTTSYVLTFEYIDEDDVKVSLDGSVTTAYSFANATTILFDSAPASDVAIRIYRDTDIDELKSTFFAGSSIRAQDLNKNFEQNNFAVQEIKNYTWDNETDTIHSDETWVSSDTQIATTAAMDQRFQDEAAETIESGETWVSDDDHIATTAAIDARFQDELSETITSSETWPNNDDTIATTAAIDDRIDLAITNDIGTDGTGITVTDDGDGTITLGLGSGSIDLDRIKNADIITSAEANPNNDTTIATTAKIDDMIDAAITGDIAVDSTGLTLTNDGDGTITLGIGSSSVDLDRIKAGDIITQSEQDSGTTETDNNIFTALAAARRFDTLVQTANPGTAISWEVGKTWLQNDDDLTLSIWNGSGWTAVTSGGTFTEQPSVVYVDQASGDDNNTGHRISTPKATIKAAIEQINAEIDTEITSGGSGYVEGSYTTVALTGGTSTGLTADITVNASGVVTAVTINDTDVLEDYSIGDVLSASNADLGGSGSGLQITVGGDGDGQIVVVSAGTYQEVAPIQIKRRNVSIIGQALRSCLVHPTTATENNILFELNSGSYISNLTLTGMQAGTGTGNTLDADLPTDQGWNFGFYDNAFIVKSPYIQNCTNFSDSEIDNDNLNSHNPAGGGAGDTDSDPTGGGMLVNGAAVHDDSPLRSMVADSYTHVGLNGPGVLVVNNGYAQITSSYAFFNKYHIKCLSGGQANLAASTTDFGDQALVADGRSTNAIFTSTTIANAADQATEFFIEGPTARTATPLPWHGTSTRPQSNMLVDIGGNTYPILSSSNTFDADEIISGRDYTILTVGDTDFTAIGAASNTVGVQFTATGVGTGSGTVTDDAGWRVTISRPDPANRNNNLGLDGAVTSGGAVSFFLRSQVASSGHTMEYVGSGTNYSALPENGGVPDESRQITESNNGKVWTAITDHNGKFKIGGNQTTDPIFEVNQQTGFITIPEGSIAFNLLSDATPQLGGDLDVNGNTITGLANPTANDEVANKAYVDAVAGTPTQIAQLNTSVVTSDTGSDGTITFTTDGTTAMTIDNNQRLGVGTTSPGHSLTVRAGTANSDIANFTGATVGRGLVIGTSNDGGAGDDTVIYNATQSTGGHVFEVNASEKVRIDSSGRVGIGTSSPDSTLELASGPPSFKLTRDTTASTGNDFGRILFENSAGTTLGSIRGYSESDNTDLGLKFSTGTNDTIALTIDEAQRVGIGTTSPQDTIDCLGRIRVTQSGNNPRFGSLEATADEFQLKAFGGAAGQTAAMCFYTGNNSPTEKARIDSSGRLLVGTSTARTNFFNTTLGAALQVEGTDNNTSTVSCVINSTSSDPIITLARSRGTAVGSNTIVSSGDTLGRLIFQGNDGSEFVQAASIGCDSDGTPGANDMPGRLVFSTTADGASSPTERMRIDSAGNISIGTTSNIAKVDVRMTGAAVNNAVYVERTSVSTAGQGVYAYMVPNSGLSSSSYSLYGAYVASTNSPGGGVIGVLSSVYGILGYYDTSNSWAVYGNGSMFTTGSYQSSSDSRLKDIVEPISGGILDKLAGIQPVKYRWKENTDQRESVGDGIQIGLIAQEVEEHFPELVKEITHNCPINPENLEDSQFDSSCSLNHELGTTKTLEYQNLTAVLVEALKEAKTRIETLEAKVAALENP